MRAPAALSLSLSLPLQGYWCLNLCHPWSFFRFNMTSSSLYFFLFRGTQIGILKRTHKGHLFSILSCVAQHTLEMHCIFLVCVSSPIAVSWTVHCWILSGSWVVRKSVVEPKKFWCLTFSEGGTFVLIECLESSQMPLYSSLLCRRGTGCNHFQI